MANVLALTCLTAFAWPSPATEGPPAGHTGGFGEPSCSTCHVGSEENAFGGRADLQGLPERYIPGETYVLTLSLTAEETATAGFQASARFDAPPAYGVSAGTFTPLDDRTAVTDSADVSYVHHTFAGSSVSDSSGSHWSFAWVAPVGGGSVTFHVAANSGNGDNSPLGDLVYTHARSLEVDASRRPRALDPGVKQTLSRPRSRP